MKMGIDYTASLVYGFELDENKVQAIWRKSKKDPGEFHMEDRFDPKTGAKLQQEKVWDRKPSTDTWYEMDGKKIDDLDCEDWESFLAETFGCNVMLAGSFPSGELSYVFHVNESLHYKDADDYGRLTVYNNVISQEELASLTHKAMLLKEKFLNFGFDLDDPTIFIAMRIS
jgi:hypothetical protein